MHLSPASEICNTDGEAVDTATYSYASKLGMEHVHTKNGFRDHALAERHRPFIISFLYSKPPQCTLIIRPVCSLSQPSHFLVTSKDSGPLFLILSNTVTEPIGTVLNSATW